MGTSLYNYVVALHHQASVLEITKSSFICHNLSGDQLDEASCIVEGYNSYFSFSKVRSGYSGNIIIIIM